MSSTRVDVQVKILNDKVVRRAKERGLDMLVYAPHFTRLPTIEKRARAFSDDELTVVPAREIFTGDWRRRRHILALNLDAPIPDYITLKGALAELVAQDAVILVPHPEFLTVSLHEIHLRRHRSAFDGIEVYNPKHLPRDNRRARELAETMDLPPVTSSYAHLTRTVGEVWTEFESDLQSESDLYQALREGWERRIYHREGLGHALCRGLEFVHLGWENTWKKFDRVYLSGTEPTHPSHVAYGGEFDDVRVY